MLALPGYLIWYFVLGGKGKAIKAKFQQVGNLRGKTFDQIVAFAGKPVKATNYPGGKMIAIFGHIGYNVTLIFQNGICQGVNNETTF